jgi:hypothetical protein
MFVPNPALVCSTYLGLPVEESRNTGNENNESDERLKRLNSDRVQKNTEIDQDKKDG